MKQNKQEKAAIISFCRRVMGGAAALILCATMVACGGKPAESTQQGTEQSAEQSVEQNSGSATQDASGSNQSTTQQAEQRLDLLVLVNKTHALPDGWEEKLDLVEEVNTKGYAQQLDRLAYEPFKQLQAALEEKGVTIQLNSCYRSIAEQQAIVDEFTADYGEDYVREFVAVPGHSEHHTGLAADIYLIIDGVPQLTNEEIYAAQDTWDVIHAMMVDYGFILRYPDGREDITGYTYEPWHIRYVGPDNAHAIMDNNLTLEEFLGAV
ncbi:MAG: M15 family metallopeptidase [Coriobacteriales bacterium]|nr:M15 family metallopeptidase [Coriobacteriales bacterium]